MSQNIDEFLKKTSLEDFVKLKINNQKASIEEKEFYEKILKDITITEPIERVFMDYPLCPKCHSPLKRYGKDSFPFAQCTRCHKFWDKTELLGAYITGENGQFFNMSLIDVFWKRVMTIINVNFERNSKE
nr:MAG: Zn finger protein [uncultured archaeon]